MLKTVCSLILAQLTCSQNKSVFRLGLVETSNWCLWQDLQIENRGVLDNIPMPFLLLPKFATACTTSFGECKLAGYLHRFDASPCWPPILTMFILLQLSQQACSQGMLCKHCTQFPTLHTVFVKSFKATAQVTWALAGSLFCIPLSWCQQHGLCQSAIRTVLALKSLR